eukprot:2030876-Alexandrium_andersonii.AAC.1
MSGASAEREPEEARAALPSDPCKADACPLHPRLPISHEVQAASVRRKPPEQVLRGSLRVAGKLCGA